MPEKPCEELDLTLKDFYPLDDLSGGDAKLSLSWDSLRECVQLAAETDARTRAVDAVRRHQKSGKPDTDYVPPKGKKRGGKTTPPSQDSPEEPRRNPSRSTKAPRLN